jgi:hypothetical protein
MIAMLVAVLCVGTIHGIAYVVLWDRRQLLQRLAERGPMLGLAVALAVVAWHLGMFALWFFIAVWLDTKL